MITIDYQSKLPLYEQIAKRFETLILRGVLPPDSQLPSVRSLAVELSINPNTIQKAYSLMEQKGFIYPVKGKGNYVADSSVLARQKKTQLVSELSSLIYRCAETGITQNECIALIREIYRKEVSND